MFECLDVDDEVDQRLRGTGDTLGGGGGEEDGLQGVEAALSGAALQQPSANGIAVAGAGLVPVGVELGLFVAFQDLGHGGTDDDVALGIKMEPCPHDGDVGSAVLSGSLMVAVGAVLVGQGLPTATQAMEVCEPQAGGLCDQQLFGVGKVVADRGLPPRRASSNAWAIPIRPAANAGSTVGN